jgi:hypothetical protein
MKLGLKGVLRAAHPLVRVVSAGAVAAVVCCPSSARAEEPDARAAPPPATLSAEAPPGQGGEAGHAEEAAAREESLAPPAEPAPNRSAAPSSGLRRYALPSVPGERADEGDVRPEPARYAATGLSFQYRLVQLMAGPQAPFSAYPSGPPPLTIGYRGGSYAVGFTPYVNLFSFDRAGEDASRATWGGGANVEIDAAEAPTLRSQLYVLLGAALGTLSAHPEGSDDRGGRWSASATAGLGIRHWLHPHVAVGVEAAAAVLTLPMEGASEASSSVGPGAREELRGTLLQTSAAAAITLVL